jgi:hypothetical protein
MHLSYSILKYNGATYKSYAISESKALIMLYLMIKSLARPENIDRTFQRYPHAPPTNRKLDLLLKKNVVAEN